MVGGFVLQTLTLVLAYLKVVVPNKKANDKTIALIERMSNSLILSQERDSVDRKLHEDMLRKITDLSDLHKDKSSLCSWTNGNSDRLTAKVSKETYHLLKPILDGIAMEVRK